MDAIEVVYLAVAIRVYRFLDYVQTIFYYYRHPRFRKTDRLLIGAYFLSNPYHLSRRFLEQRGEENVYTYGETPLTTLDVIANRVKIMPTDRVFELGMGRGRTCFWLRNFMGCRVVGIEFVPLFVSRAQAIATTTQTDGVEFRCEDYLTTDLTGATVCYLYGSNLEDRVIQRLIERFAQLPKGTRFVTISFPLSDYAKQPIFELVDRFPAWFLWGTATVYVEVKR